MIKEIRKANPQGTTKHAKIFRLPVKDEVDKFDPHDVVSVQ